MIPKKAKIREKNHIDKKRKNSLGCSFKLRFVPLIPAFFVTKLFIIAARLITKRKYSILFPFAEELSAMIPEVKTFFYFFSIKNRID